MTHRETRGASAQVREFELVTEDTEIEVAKGMMFYAHHSRSVELGWVGFVDVVE